MKPFFWSGLWRNRHLVSSNALLCLPACCSSNTRIFVSPRCRRFLRALNSYALSKRCWAAAMVEVLLRRKKNTGANRWTSQPRMSFFRPCLPPTWAQPKSSLARAFVEHSPSPSFFFWPVLLIMWRLCHSTMQLMVLIFF